MTKKITNTPMQSLEDNLHMVTKSTIYFVDHLVVPFYSSSVATFARGGKGRYHSL